jgi:hypothetical protein
MHFDSTNYSHGHKLTQRAQVLFSRVFVAVVINDCSGVGERQTSVRQVIKDVKGRSHHHSPFPWAPALRASKSSCLQHHHRSGSVRAGERAGDCAADCNK